jgi:hypothetical protein
VFLASATQAHALDVHPENQTQGGADTYSIRLVYLIEEKQLTKEMRGKLLVTGTPGGGRKRD